MVIPFLLELVRYCGIPVPNNISPGALSKILQEKWKLRNGSLWDGAIPTLQEMDFLADLGYFSDIPLSLDDRSHKKIPFDSRLLVLGTTRLDIARARIEFLETERKKVPHVQEFHLLAGKRPVSGSTVSFAAETFGDACLHAKEGLTEEIFMQYVAKKILRETGKIVPIVAEGDDVGDNRAYADTGDTFNAWLKKTGVKEGVFILASSQPTLSYQLFSCRRLIPKGYNIKLYGVGPAADCHLPMKYFLDVIAKQLYEEVEWHKYKESA
jgi:hypothetical protein